MKKIILYILLIAILPKLSLAQGIVFSEPKNWSELLAKAKLEKKNIFVDFYTTWCVPCKQMDEQVYPLESIGKILNKNFISVKIQLDSTASDNAFVRAWRATAYSLKDKYAINSMPTFLFLDSEGSALHKESGFKNEKQFTSLLSDAQDPDNQVFSLFKKFKHDYTIAPKLIDVAKRIGEIAIAKQIASEYLNNYLLKLPTDKILTKDNLWFVNQNLTWKDERALKLLMDHKIEIDSILRYKNFSEKTIIYYLTEECKNVIKSTNDRPKWNDVGNKISKAYHKYSLDTATANLTLLYVKSWYYFENRDLYEQSLCGFQIFDKQKQLSIGPSLVEVNNQCYNIIFKNIADKEVLGKAIEWMIWVIKQNPINEEDINFTRVNFHDSYANVLYKYGRKEEAIALQQKILQWCSKLPEIVKQRQATSIKGFKQNLEKMMHGQPTWPVKV